MASESSATRSKVRTLVMVCALAHLLILVALPKLTPNPGTAEHSKLMRDPAPNWMRNYVRFFGLESNWQFFAPDPWSLNTWLDYSFETRDGQTIGDERFPQKSGIDTLVSEPWMRRVVLSRGVTLSPELLGKTLVPYLCHQRPTADSVSIWRTVEGVPNRADIANGFKTLRDSVIVVEKKFMVREFCPHGTKTGSAYAAH